mmetsp:Transcript_68934/g.109386  ORF Transcript_68934/g.109386 Transcript_68934/m.109386 type:complete len:128 (+) Transcript_68934:54-437(+)|eukprot:CAMPEP_0169118022 /NCGR_PEP_ID=MMETSP1015-20121227/30775_1 /TAXON_ID=342587 /ORGANISM="Karlodinium micrum, Strain CCMP2283" /LENGTH=127 /DNA_ID=CAMNT_0009180755 /DNA_START=62 /DNA_END=445 /DNA_ORIENTATION=+
MAPLRKIVDQEEEDEEIEHPRKRSKANILAISTPQNRAEESLDVVKRGGGKGLKAVQTSHERATTRDKANGEKMEAKTKVKEQKLYMAKSNAHVETKTMSEGSTKKVKKDGTVTVTSSTTVTKVSYL